MRKTRKQTTMEWWKKQLLVARLFLKYVYFQCLQKLYKTVRHVKKNHYEIQYVLHDNLYKIKTQVKRGPSSILRVMDHQQNDITEEMRSYWGPNEDFHGQSIRPFDLGYEKIRIELRHGKEKEFECQEPIVLL